MLGAFFPTLPALHAQGGKLGRPKPDCAAQPCCVHEFFPVGIVGRYRLLYSSKQSGIFTPDGQGMQVLAAGAADFHEFTVFLSTLFTSCSSFSVSESGYALSATAEILPDMRLVIHPGEDNRDLRMVPYPAERPFCRGPLTGASSQILLWPAAQFLVRFHPEGAP